MDIIALRKLTVLMAAVAFFSNIVKIAFLPPQATPFRVLCPAQA